MAYRSLSTAMLIQRNLPNICLPLRPDAGRIRIDGLDLTVDPDKAAIVLHGMRYLHDLKLDFDAQFAMAPSGEVDIRLGSLSVTALTAQELFIVWEVFCEGIYNVESPEPMFVWDVGANVGIASLFFAGVHGWGVAAYELFPPTAEAAHQNIRKSGLESLVTLNSYGLGLKNERLSLPYNERSRGSNGLFGNTALDKSGPDQMMQVEVRDAAEEFARIKELAAGRPILAKLDCEGSEYGIIQRLSETGQLRDIAAIVMEIHALEGFSAEKLSETLVSSRFLVKRPHRMSSHVDIVYATRI